MNMNIYAVEQILFVGIDKLEKGLYVNIKGSLHIFEGFRFPIRQNIGKWSDISSHSIQE